MKLSEELYRGCCVAGCRDQSSTHQSQRGRSSDVDLKKPQIPRDKNFCYHLASAARSYRGNAIGSEVDLYIVILLCGPETQWLVFVVLCPALRQRRLTAYGADKAPL